MGVDFGQEGDGTLAQGERARCTVYLTMTHVHRLAACAATLSLSWTRRKRAHSYACIECSFLPRSALEHCISNGTQQRCQQLGALNVIHRGYLPPRLGWCAVLGMEGSREVSFLPRGSISLPISAVETAAALNCHCSRLQPPTVVHVATRSCFTQPPPAQQLPGQPLSRLTSFAATWHLTAAT